MKHVFTITARNYLSLALTLGDSVRQHHPEAGFTIFLADGAEGIDPGTLAHEVVDARQALGTDFDPALPFKYNITEYCTAIKPGLFRHLFEARADVELVYYMDPDTFLYDRLDAITEPEPAKTLFLTPHLLECRLADDNPFPEYRHLWTGIFNLGFCAIRRSAVSARIIDWWDDRLRKYCYADHHDGLHTDQKWMDFAPVFFGEDTAICRHPGANVAYWNFVERLPERRHGRYAVGDRPLIFFHFSGIDCKGTELTKHVPETLQRHIGPDVADMLADYRRAVLRNHYEVFIGIPYGYAAYTDGVPVSQQHRRLFRVLETPELKAAPFAAEGPFRRLIDGAGLLDTSPAAAKSHNASTLGDLGAIHARAQRLLKLMLRVAGPRRYVYLTKFFSLYGRFEAHAFLLKDAR